ncbi:hypothetical protein SLE2022_215350 [Rubroshorea leprosula]
MASASISKPPRWFNKSLKLSLPRRRSKRKSPTPSPVLSPKEAELQEVFRRFDSDGDGKISCSELTTYFVSIGESISRAEAQSVIGEFDDNGDGLLEFRDFIKMVEGGSDVDDDLRGAFEMFEAEKGCGCITPRGLQKMFNRLGEVRSDEECVAMIRVFDLDGNGVLDFHEFQQMMKGDRSA